MATYRESREARAERLREWSAKRAEKAEAGFERASELASVIPMGQPILVGHMATCDAMNGRYRCSREPGHDPRHHQDPANEVEWAEGYGPAELDTASSASRQHYIDTGRYLRAGEALDA